MKKAKITSFLILVIALFARSLNSQLVHTHLAGVKTYDKNTNQDNFRINLGEDFEQTK